ncbi:hypothetical protein MACJ_001847 [Theileria orientalis]|uniref:GTPase n=1 Tax=Theileria orientalis TaxID=68886 RepID=A0A976M552_THEOR|nr:hypothetical protein MACJ_001847 [Theileria orientalis]
MDKLVSSAIKKTVTNVTSTSRPFVDIKQIKCVGGRGGNGALAFSKHGSHHLMGPGLPVGGRGGNGGSVFAEPVKITGEAVDFRSIPSVVVAKNGLNGKGSKINGNSGADVILKMPVGTLIYKYEPMGLFDNWRDVCKEWNKKLIADIDSLNHERILLASGGLGGLGNTLKNPYESEDGKKPEENYYEIRLKLIADIGLLGLPNVGKSTLFSSVTRGCSKIGDYPFTTLAPYVGYIRYNDGTSISMVDLPGIVDASINNTFLHHLERVKLILYLIDPCNPTYGCIDNFNLLRDQLTEHNLNEKPFVVVTTKMDIASKMSSVQADQLQQYLCSIGIRSCVVPISAKYNMGLEKLVCELRKQLETTICI